MFTSCHFETSALSYLLSEFAPSSTPIIWSYPYSYISKTHLLAPHSCHAITYPDEQKQGFATYINPAMHPEHFVESYCIDAGSEFKSSCANSPEKYTQAGPNVCCYGSTQDDQRDNGSPLALYQDRSIH